MGQSPHYVRANIRYYLKKKFSNFLVIPLEHICRCICICTHICILIADFRLTSPFLSPSLSPEHQQTAVYQLAATHPRQLTHRIIHFALYLCLFMIIFSDPGII